jgi:hypothetical protein
MIYSLLVNSGQLTRNEALEQLKGDIYAPELAAQDYDFVLKKFGLTTAEYESLLGLPPKSHLDYPNLSVLYIRSSRLLEWFKMIAKSV